MQRDNKEFLMGVPEVTRTYFIERIEERKAALAESPEGEGEEFGRGEREG